MNNLSKLGLLALAVALGLLGYLAANREPGAPPGGASPADGRGETSAMTAAAPPAEQKQYALRQPVVLQVRASERTSPTSQSTPSADAPSQPESAPLPIQTPPAPPEDLLDSPTQATPTPAPKPLPPATALTPVSPRGFVPPPPAPGETQVAVEMRGKELHVTIDIGREARFKTLTLSAPPRFVVDIPGRFPTPAPVALPTKGVLKGIHSWAHDTYLRVVLELDGGDIRPQARAVSRGVDVFVPTPKQSRSLHTPRR